MARGVKKAKAATLTPEEKLAQALVPVEEQPYPVPGNWCWTFLTKGFADCKDGFRKPINATERADRIGEIPYYGATGQVGWIDDYLTDEELVLLGEDGAPFLDLQKDKAYLISGKAWVNNHAHILKSLYGHTGNLYMLNYLNIFNYTGYVNGTTRLKLTQASMDTIPVPVAPLSEQRRIVDRIESLFAKLDEAKEKAQAVVDGFEDRKAAILHKAFAGKLTEKWRNKKYCNDGRWEKCTLGDVFDLQSGKNISASMISKEKSLECPYPCFGGNGIRGYVKNYNREGTHPIIGRQGALCGNVNLANGRFYATEHAVVVSYKKPVDTVWAENYLRFLNLNQYATATAQPGLAVSKIISVPICYVPIDEQREIAKIMNSILTKEQQAKDAAEQALAQIDTMKKAILARAFRGELGTNDPTDESAMELLKQLQ